VARYYAHRASDPDRWLAGMNVLQQRLETALEGASAAPSGKSQQP
jgi:hypothetical protein